ncbi:MerR family transcriptional regulator [Massilia sp. LXY-6]|uniref:MerR family transcriptional regulator n=1 Tax=Massilia sp. LXY-6 TaxID=3379823 RepID=UPI003EE374BC
MLKVGELAALADLTVRTLHHYDSIGLLQPSARSDAGYRLYDRDDVARLHQIQALRSFGMSLADIGLYLDSPAGSPLAVVERQIAALEQQIHETKRMREQLLRLRGELAGGATPELSTWLTTLGQTMDMMNVYEKYFSREELEKLPIYRDDAVKAQWAALVEQAAGLMQSQVAPESEAAKAFALRWLQAFERDTAGDPDLAAKLNVMARREQDAVGIPGPVMNYVFQATAELKYDTWSKHLRPIVIARMRRHHATRGHEWTGLIDKVRAGMQADPDAAGPQAHELARQWMALFHDMVGTDSRDIDAFRAAITTEPVLRMGPGISDAMLGWLRRALAASR